MLELRKAFHLCTNTHTKNKRLILVYLVAASLPLGVFPRPELLKSFDLGEQFDPLIHAVKVCISESCFLYIAPQAHSLFEQHGDY